MHKGRINNNLHDFPAASSLSIFAHTTAAPHRAFSKN